MLRWPAFLTASIYYYDWIVCFSGVMFKNTFHDKHCALNKFSILAHTQEFGHSFCSFDREKEFFSCNASWLYDILMSWVKDCVCLCIKIFILTIKTVASGAVVKKSTRIILSSFWKRKFYITAGYYYSIIVAATTARKYSPRTLW